MSEYYRDQYRTRSSMVGVRLIVTTVLAVLAALALWAVPR